MLQKQRPASTAVSVPGRWVTAPVAPDPLFVMRSPPWSSRTGYGTRQTPPLELVDGHKAQRRQVPAIPQPARLVVEDVAEVAVGKCRAHLGARQLLRVAGLSVHERRVDRLREAQPPLPLSHLSVNKNIRSPETTSA